MSARSDGLLRGAWEERSKAMRSLKDGDWNLETLLDLHTGLLDPGDDVRVAAMCALQKLAERQPDAIQLTPVSMLSYFTFAFTVSSGMALSTFKVLAELDTAEARRAVEEVLLRVQRNEDFSDFVGVLRRANKLDILRSLETAKLSKTKATALRSALTTRKDTDHSTK